MAKTSDDGKMSTGRRAFPGTAGGIAVTPLVAGPVSPGSASQAAAAFDAAEASRADVDLFGR
ncbi:hypothetical protein [Rhizobium sp. A37_96]